jgi:hypothetical protein
MEQTLASMRVGNEDCNLKTLSDAKNPLLAKRKKKEAALAATVVPPPPIAEVKEEPKE